jgi:hypothetical protein
VDSQPTVEARAWARDGSRSRWGALAEQGEAGIGRYCPYVDKLNSKQRGGGGGGESDVPKLIPTFFGVFLKIFGFYC